MPLWARPATIAEVRQFLREGRAQVGKTAAREPLDLARAVARLGTARGVVAFERFGYIERNGQSNLAVPLGRFCVPNDPRIGLECLDDLESWLVRLRRQARDQRAPARLRQAERRLSDALFAVLQHSDEPGRWQTVLVALASVEEAMVSGSGFAAGPVPRLRPDWAQAADDGSPTFRLALACALQAAGWTKDRRPVDGVRRHWLPLKGSRFNTTSEGLRQRLVSDCGVVLSGRDGCTDAIRLVERRLVESQQRGQRRLRLQAAPATGARLGDLALFVAGEIDIDRTLALARGLMPIDGVAWASSPPEVVQRPTYTSIPDDAWLALRLSLLPWPLANGKRVGADPAIVRRLAAGDATGAVDVALRRLGAAGISATVRAATADPATSRRWAAALAFPITQKTAGRIARRLDPMYVPENPHDR
jgi:CRISPR-associated protein Csx17